MTNAQHILDLAHIATDNVLTAFRREMVGLLSDSETENTAEIIKEVIADALHKLTSKASEEVAEMGFAADLAHQRSLMASRV